MSAKDAFHVGTKEGYLQSIIEYLPKDDKVMQSETLPKRSRECQEARIIADPKSKGVGEGESKRVDEGAEDKPKEQAMDLATEEFP